MIFNNFLEFTKSDVVERDADLADQFSIKGIDRDNGETTKNKFKIEVLEEKTNYDSLIYSQTEETDGTYILSVKLEEISGMKEIN